MTSSPCVVTVGMPVYNGEAFVSRSVLSVLEQTFSGSMEFLIVDDGSSDGTADVIRQVAAAHPRGGIVRVIRHDANQGVGSARNTILDHAQGKYLYFLDSDDEIAPDCIEKLHAQAERYQAEAVYGSIYTVCIDGETVKGVETYVQSHLVFTHEDELACYAFRDIHEHLRDYSVNILFLREFLEKHHLRFKQFISIYSDVKDMAQLSKGKPYYEARYLRSMTQMFFIVCGALKNRRIISPRLTDGLVRKAMTHPAALSEIIHFRRHRLYNLAYYALGKMPGWLTVLIMTAIAKQKRIL